MNLTRSLAVARLVFPLGLIAAATFGGGLLFASAFGDYLPEPTPSVNSRECTTGCPAMLPCGMPLVDSEWENATCEFPGK